MRYAGILAAGVLLSGCLVDVLTSAAIQGELQAQQATAAQNTLNRVKNDTGQVNLQQAVSLYQAEKGTYPESLDLLVPNFINSIPARADGGAFGYNPITGQVLDDDSGPAPADYLMMEQIRVAINNYGAAVQYYPPTLDTLTQTGYLTTYPRTVDGREFIYNNQNGAVAYPGSGGVPQTTAPNLSAPAGGGGPLGEAMTGIAIQEQLNSNSNAGSSAASSRGRSGARDAAARQTDRQQKALDELGF